MSTTLLNLFLGETYMAEKFKTGLLQDMKTRYGFDEETVQSALDFVDHCEGKHDLPMHIWKGRIGIIFVLNSIINRFPDGNYPSIEEVLKETGLDEHCSKLKGFEIDVKHATQEMVEPMRRMHEVAKETARIVRAIPNPSEKTADALSTDNPKPLEIKGVNMVNKTFTSEEMFQSDFSTIHNLFGEANVEVGVPAKAYVCRQNPGLLTVATDITRRVWINQQSMFIPYDDGQSIIVHFPESLQETYEAGMIAYHEDPYKMYGTSSMPLSYKGIDAAITDWVKSHGLVGFEAILPQPTKVTDVHGTQGTAIDVKEIPPTAE